jgi:hypothetical protein
MLLLELLFKEKGYVGNQGIGYYQQIDKLKDICEVSTN